MNDFTTNVEISSEIFYNIGLNVPELEILRCRTKCVRINMYVFVYVCVCVCVRERESVRICMCIYMCVWGGGGGGCVYM